MNRAISTLTLAALMLIMPLCVAVSNRCCGEKHSLQNTRTEIAAVKKDGVPFSDYRRPLNPKNTC